MLHVFISMPDSQIEDIKSRLNIVDVVSNYVQLKKAGVNFRARCPFHNEKTPSFYVTPARQIWHCFGCGLGGDIFEFIKQIEGVDFREALERLAEKAGVELTRREFNRGEALDRKKILYELNNLAARFYHKVLSESKIAAEAREYLKKRNFLPATIAVWKIGYAPDAWDTLYQFLKKKGYQENDMVEAGLVIRRDEGGFFDRFRDRITFPIVDMLGRTVGFSARVLHARDDVGKYINSPESPIYSKSEILFGLFAARNEIRRENTGIIVEGNVDVVKSHQAGVANAVAASGTALTGQHLLKLKRLCENLVFAFDADRAGLEAAKRSLDSALSMGFWVKLISPAPGLKDPDEIIDKDPGLWKKLVTEAEDFLDFYFHRIFDILNLEDAHAKKQAIADFLSLLAKVPDAIIRAHYVRKTAEAVSVKEELVADLLRQSFTRKSAEAGTGSASQKIAVALPSVPLERCFIGLLFRQGEHWGHFLSVHEPSHFLDSKYQSIFKQIKEGFETNKELIPDDFLKNRPQLKTELELAMFSTEVQFADREQMLTELSEVSRRLRKDYINREKVRLGQEITNAEKARDLEKRNLLSAEFNNLIQKEADLDKTNLRTFLSSPPREEG